MLMMTWSIFSVRNIRDVTLRRRWISTSIGGGRRWGPEGREEYTPLGALSSRRRAYCGWGRQGEVQQAGSCVARRVAALDAAAQPLQPAVHPPCSSIVASHILPFLSFCKITQNLNWRQNLVKTKVAKHKIPYNTPLSVKFKFWKEPSAINQKCLKFKFIFGGNSNLN